MVPYKIHRPALPVILDTLQSFGTQGATIRDLEVATGFAYDTIRQVLLRLRLPKVRPMSEWDKGWRYFRYESYAKGGPYKHYFLC